MDLSPLLLKPGDVCTAFGEVVSVDGQVTFGPSMPSGAVAPRPKPRPGEGAFPIAGIDPNNLMFRHEIDGAIEGQATMTVKWREGSLEVVDQRAERPPFLRPRFTTPPGPPPPGRWKQTDGLHLPQELEDELKAAGLLVKVGVVRVQPEFVEWMADVPTDLLEVTAWLDPTRAGPGTLEI